MKYVPGAGCSTLGIFTNLIIYYVMAKSDGFFGLRRGSTKSLTFAVNGGMQITKDRVTDVRNPRTEAQMLQRMCLATAGKFYSEGKEIFDHSVENVTYGRPTMSFLSSENSKILRENAAQSKGSFKPYEAPFLVKNAGVSALMISKGSLSSLAYTSESCIIYDGVTFVGRKGDLITLVGWGFDTVQNGYKLFGWVRYEVKETIPAEALTGLTQENWYTKLSPYITVSLGGAAYSMFQPSQCMKVVAGKLNVVFTDAIKGKFGVILSRKAGDKWLRSTQYIASDAEAAGNFDAAIASYPSKPNKILNGGAVNMLANNHVEQNNPGSGNTGGGGNTGGDDDDPGNSPVI